MMPAGGVRVGSVCAVAVTVILGTVVFGGGDERARAQVAGLAIADAYESQSIDSPSPVIGGGFGGEFVNAGDIDGDGEDDLLVSQQTGAGLAFVISGDDGTTIRTLTPPDPSTGGNAARFGLYVGAMADIGSCPGGAVSVTCPAVPIGPGDGVPELIVSASGIDFGSVLDIGRVYVFDGATGAVLKRIDMPAADRAEQAAVTPQPRPDFGRSVLVPASPYPDSAPAEVKIGDVDGGGRPDIIVGASFFYEAGPATNPTCDPGPCSGSGRVYFYRGEDVAGSDPNVVLDTPFETIKNPMAQTDDPDTSFQQPNSELFGFSTIPIGDVGKCNIDPGAGNECTTANSTTTPDGRPDVVITESRADFPQDFFDSGVAWLVDGPTGSLLAMYKHPQPQSASALGLGIYNQPAIGDAAGTNHPDFFLPAMTHHDRFVAQGRGWVMNGNFKTTASFVALSQLDDPTPQQAGNFGSSSSGIGNVAGDHHNEMLVGSAGPRFPGTDDQIPGDVHIFSPVSAEALLTIDDPDAQPGSGFGSGVAPLGDVNDDGFIDFAAGSAFYDGATGINQGRLYIFHSTVAPTPTPTPTVTEPVEIERTISLRLRKHLRAKGVVAASAAQETCADGVAVVIKRNGKRIKTITTEPGGSYSTRVRDRTGRYRAIAPEVATADVECLVTRSKVRRHRH